MGASRGKSESLVVNASPEQQELKQLELLNKIQEKHRQALYAEMVREFYKLSDPEQKMSSETRAILDKAKKEFDSLQKSNANSLDKIYSAAAILQSAHDDIRAKVSFSFLASGQGINASPRADKLHEIFNNCETKLQQIEMLELEHSERDIAQSKLNNAPKEDPQQRLFMLDILDHYVRQKEGLEDRDVRIAELRRNLPVAEQSKSSQEQASAPSGKNGSLTVNASPEQQELKQLELLNTIQEKHRQALYADMVSEFYKMSDPNQKMSSDTRAILDKARKEFDSINKSNANSLDKIYSAAAILQSAHDDIRAKVSFSFLASGQGINASPRADKLHEIFNNCETKLRQIEMLELERSERGIVQSKLNNASKEEPQQRLFMQDILDHYVRQKEGLEDRNARIAELRRTVSVVEQSKAPQEQSKTSQEQEYSARRPRK